MTQNNLGNAWSDTPAGDKAENLHKAITCYEATLSVCTKTGDPFHWAMTQNNLGTAWRLMPTGDKADNLRKAIGCTKAALLVYTAKAFPSDHKLSEDLLQTLRKVYESSVAPKAIPFDEIPPAE